MRSVEDYLIKYVQPYYANVHSESGILAEQSEKFRKEAKSIVRRHFSADERDSVIFHGQGTTVREVNYNKYRDALIN